VVPGLDLLAQIPVLLLEARSLALGEHPCGDVDDHRARVAAVGLGARPALHEHGTPVVLAAQLDLDGAALASRLLRGERLVHALLRVGHGCDQGQAVGVRDLLRLQAEQVHECAVRAHEPGAGLLVDVRDRRLLEEAPERLLGLAQAALDVDALELADGACGEDLEQADARRRCGERRVVHQGEVTANRAVGAKQR